MYQNKDNYFSQKKLIGNEKLLQENLVILMISKKFSCSKLKTKCKKSDNYML